MKSAGDKARASDLPLQRFAGVLLVLGLVLGLMFFESFTPGKVHASNDGPLGAAMAEQLQFPGAFSAIWQTLNWVGGWVGSAAPNLSNCLLWLLGPVGFAKFYAPLSILVLGLCAWLAFRQMGLGSVACMVGALAAALNTGFFSYACWGLGTLTLAVASFFLAVAAWGCDPARRSWLRVVLAGFAVGMGVMEGFDSGAILSVFFAAYVLVRTWIEHPGEPAKLGGGLLRLGVVAVAAGLLAAHAMFTLITTQIQGVAGMGQDQQTRDKRWTEATQWSLPKTETLRLFIAGLHGYRLDTPDGGAYWGGVGRDATWEAFLAQESPSLADAPQGGLPRHSGSGFYCGVFVCLVAVWAFFRSLGTRDNPYRPDQRRVIWFWAAVAFVSLLLSWGKHAPFYAIVYELPYFSTIRNPIKFLHPLNLGILMLFAYGVDGLWRAWTRRDTAGERAGARFGAWWRAAAGFNRHWVIGSVIAVAVSVFVTLLYGSAREEMVKYLMLVGYADPAGGSQTATGIFQHSLREIGWYLIFLVAGVVLVGAMMSGALRRSGSGLAGMILLLAVTGADLVRANLPWLSFYDYRARYASTPLYEFLAREPWQHRTQALPSGLMQFQLNALQQSVEARQLNQLFQMVLNFGGAYRGQWAQQQFHYYNIQSTDLVQEPRPTVENELFRAAFAPADLNRGLTMEDIRAEIRLMRLLNARYFFGLGGAALAPLNQLAQPADGEFRDVLPLWMTARDGAILPAIETNSPISLIEFTGALPRAKLFANWRRESAGPATLDLLRSPAFDPARLVVVDGELPEPVTPDEADPGTVEITDYHPRSVQMTATVKTPSVLLFNDKHDPHWQVRVDGEPATLLRANYLMRGLHLLPGEHRIEWRFQPPTGGLYVSVAAIVAGLILTGLVVAQARRPRTATAKAN